MGQYLIDNNVISNYFAGSFAEKEMQFIAEVIDQIPNISIITEIEALSWINADKNKEESVKQFINDSNILGLTRDVINKCVELRRQWKLKTPDAIIAATAVVNNLTLITSDKDFNKIEGLSLINP